ncbi:sensor histidine kinase [Geothrix sp. 21YS21S-4]|uniref:sensor histidine kinase n=1 Tax=Geothrix sp. 21YS21S-4 TaxID=3068889 RepID=UPI0027B92CC5|nr:histidine kinase [Geothrix sp. 21YS21S-4]
MRLGPLQQHFRSRLRKRTPWAVVLVFAAVFIGLQFVVVPAGLQARHSGTLANALLTPFLVSFAYGFLSPLPWRWSGDDRPRAPFGRGLVQALVFNSAVILLLTALSWLLVRNASLKAEALGLARGAKVGLGSVVLVQLLAGTPLMTIIGAIISFAVITEEEKAAAEARLEEAQWVLLRGQLSPHVLFNSLNGLAELVRQDPAAAEQGILDLSELYRALLRHGDRPKAPLGEERALVQRFLAVEQLRLGTRLAVRWEWDEALDGIEAPPFLLQPLVENALKHGIAPHPGGGEIVISLRREGAGLRLRVVNTGRGMGLVPGTGVGIQNLEARLALAYGSQARFHLRPEGSATLAEVALERLETRR